MDMKQLLEAVTKFSGEEVGQKPGDQVRGTEKARPTKSGQAHPFKGRLVGGGAQENTVPSLKDLSQLSEEQQIEWKLKEMWANFNEENIGVHPKRPGRKSDRHARGHEPQPGYKTVKTDEAVGQQYTVIVDRKGRERPVTGTMEDLLDYFGYTLEVGKSYEHERGRYKINMTPKNVQQLVDNLNKAATNAAANSAPSTYYSVGKQQVAEGVPYKATNPHPASKDPIVAKVLKQMRPGLTGLEMNNEAFLYFAYEIGKMRAREMWEDYGPAIKYFYQSGIGVNEGWESGPEEYKEPYDDADDAYDRRRQEKLDIEAEKANAKRPQEKVYTLLGRGPNMEPNYVFPGEYASQEEAIAARDKLMNDPDTPYPEHIGIHSYTRYLDKTDESRAHKQLATWFKNRELQDKFAKGELKIPTPQERKAELEKSKEPVKEYGASMSGATGTSGAATSTTTPPSGTGNPTDPEAVKKAAAALTQIKAATNSPAPPAVIAKALDAADQGKQVGSSDMKALKPMMDVIKQAAQDPKLAAQFKTLSQQARQVQQK